MAIVQIETLPDHDGRVSRAIKLELRPPYGHKLCQIRRGLIAENAKLADSKGVIKSNAEALLYLIQEAATP